MRKALGVSLDAMAGLLSFYLGGKVYTRGMINIWERRERGDKLPARYAMPVQVRTAYLLLMGDVIERVGKGKFRLRARMGQRVWRFSLERDCVQCGRPFRMRRSNAARCRRCLRKGKQ